jgi:hypothetical protein
MDLLSHSDIQSISEIIERKLKRLLRFDVKLNEYASSVNDELHALIVANKLARIFTEDEVEAVLALTSIRRLLACFPGASLSECTYGDRIVDCRPCIYMRIVRPGKKGDVGPVHADIWFDELYETPIDKRAFLKVWIPIVKSAEKNGLEFVTRMRSGASIRYTKVDTPYGPRPYCDDSQMTFEQPRIHAGQCFIFDNKVLHRGSLDAGVLARVSIEIALCNVDADWLENIQRSGISYDINNESMAID